MKELRSTSTLPLYKEDREKFGVQEGFPRYKNADPMEYGLLKAYARENRKNMTRSESILWSQIKGKVLGVTFLRQYIIGNYITDFACLEHQGFKVIRFTNEEVECDIDNTINEIKMALRGTEFPPFKEG